MHRWNYKNWYHTPKKNTNLLPLTSIFTNFAAYLFKGMIWKRYGYLGRSWKDGAIYPSLTMLWSDALSGLASENLLQEPQYTGWPRWLG